MAFDFTNIWHKISTWRPFKKAPIEVKPIPTDSVPVGLRGDLDKKLVMSLATCRWPDWQQLQYLPQYLSKKEKIIIRSLLALVIIALGFLVFNFYQRHVEYVAQPGGEYTEALVGQPAYVNPLLAQTDVDRDLTRLVYSGLFKYDEQLQVVPDLASSYEISEDKKTYSIHLKPDLKWQNGNAIMADDVIFTFETLADPSFASPLATNFKGVTVQRVDDQTVSFTLKEPFAPFLSNLTVGILPAHLWSDVSPTNFRLAEYNMKPIGSGPLMFKELTKDKSGNVKAYSLERNINYYSQPSYLDTITFKLYPDFDTAVNALKNNSVVGLSYLPASNRDALSKNKDIVIHNLRLPQYTAVFFNQKNSLLKVKEIRQALAHAIDRQRIISEAEAGEAFLANGPILEGFLGYNAGAKQYAFDQAKAGGMLDAAGWKIPDGGGLRQKSGAELRFSLTTVDQPEYVHAANIIQENWEAIGVGIELKILNPNRVSQEIIKPKDYEALLYGEILGADPDPYPFWHSSQTAGNGLNLSAYYNKEADKLLEAARQQSDPNARAKNYVDFQNILLEDEPAIFLFSPAYDYPINKKIKGVATELITTPSGRLNMINQWYLKTKLHWK
ncbi:MAG: ABC transporter substrate-binding protein [Patescibacteria group bacterium]